MTRASLLCPVLATLIVTSSWATIINVPDQYSTIQAGINASVDGDTVLVAPGTYYENILFGGHNVVLASYYLTTGDNSLITLTTIDGNSAGRVISFEDREDSSAAVIGFKIRNGRSSCGSGVYFLNSNPRIMYNFIESNVAFFRRNNNAIGLGGGIYCDSSSPMIYSNYIKDNHAYDVGGGIFCAYESHPLINNNIILSNSCNVGGGGGGLYSHDDSHPIVGNNTIINNSDGVCCLDSSTVIINCIIWGNIAGQIFGVPSVAYCDISDSLWEGAGNISENPSFRDLTHLDFHLTSVLCGDSADSPCIDAGDPDSHDFIMDCQNGLGTQRADIGAYGGQGSSITTDIYGFEFNPHVPAIISLVQNYPNPFNPTTTIAYELPHACRVRLEVFDLLGRRVAMLEDGEKPAGKHQAVWNAGEVSSGIYFYRLIVGDKTEIKKMTLLR